MIAHQIARGLAKAHEVGVIHRDLKPANVYLTQRDNGQLLVKLLDFGVSKLLGEDPGSARITGTGAPIGTPLYMAPEQAEGKDSVDGRADVWSLGAVLYEALAGATPFADRGSYHGTIVGILTSRPKLLHDAAPWVPAQVAAVVDAMLVHDPNARLPNAAVVAQRLLDAFPTVLPDGTGHHTAVIVSQAAAAIDTTGDTEVFDAASMKGARVRTSQPVSYPSGPPSGPPSRRTDPPARQSAPPPPSRQDSKMTMPETPVGGGANESLRTGSATPVGRAVDFETTLRTRSPAIAPPPPPSVRMPISGPPPSAPPPSYARQDESVLSTGGPRTAPFLPPSSVPPSPPPTSSNVTGGVSLPVTPPAIDPLPGAVRDAKTVPLIRRKADEKGGRRRGMMFLTILLLIVGVALGGFLAGRRANFDLLDRPWVTPTSTTPTSTPSASVPPPAEPSAAPSPPPAPPPTHVDVPSASTPSATPPRRRLLKPKLPPTKPSESEDIPSTTE
jgi:eukaryotic-like serine/threonine-protein kinase